MKKLSYLSVVVVFLALTTLVCDKSPMTEQSVLGSAAQEKTLSKASNGIPFQGVSNENLVESLVVNGKFGVKNPESGLFTMAVLNNSVGIGTTSPTAKLDVVGTTELNGLVTINNNTVSQALNVTGFVDISNEIRLGDFGAPNDPGYTWLGDVDTGMFRAANNELGFTTGGTEKVRISSTGNVGIGTTTPTEKLHVVGTSFLQGALRLGNTFLTGVNALVINDPGQGEGISWGAQEISVYTLTQGGVNAFQFDTISGFPFAFIGGNVGIGTNNPQGTLDVNGSIFQRGGQLHADYVFESDYELEPIEEHANFMWNNKHLKAIPKAKMDEHGQEIVEVGAHRKGIVEELEKAHIYIEQLNQRLKAMEKKLASLEVGANSDR